MVKFFIIEKVSIFTSRICPIAGLVAALETKMSIPPNFSIVYISEIKIKIQNEKQIKIKTKSINAFRSDSFPTWHTCPTTDLSPCLCNSSTALSTFFCFLQTKKKKKFKIKIQKQNRQNYRLLITTEAPL